MTALVVFILALIPQRFQRCVAGFNDRGEAYYFDLNLGDVLRSETEFCD